MISSYRRVLSSFRRIDSKLLSTYRYNTFGSPSNVVRPETDEVLSSVDANSLLVRFLGAAISSDDTAVVRGEIPLGSLNGAGIVGMAGIGTVQMVGSNVNAKVEDYVIAIDETVGTVRKYGVVKPSSVVNISQSKNTSAAVGAHIHSLASALIILDSTKLVDNDVVLLNCPESVIGQTILQLAPRRNLKTVAFTSSTKGEEICREFGAHRTISLSDSVKPEYKRTIEAKLAVDEIGGKGAANFAKHVAQQGKIVMAAQHQGLLNYSLRSFVFQDITVDGFNFFAWVKSMPAGIVSKYIKAAAYEVANGRIKLNISSRRADQVVDVMRETCTDRSPFTLLIE